MTLERAVRELSPVFHRDASEPARLILFQAEGEQVELSVAERVERHFLMHLVGVELVMPVPAEPLPEVVLEIRNTGVITRTGIACRSSSEWGGLDDLKRKIESDTDLVNALMVFDFRRIVVRSDGGWQVIIEPYGACEIANRMPSFRRYVRLGSDNVKAMARVFLALRRILRAG